MGAGRAEHAIVRLAGFVWRRVGFHHYQLCGACDFLRLTVRRDQPLDVRRQHFIGDQHDINRRQRIRRRDRGVGGGSAGDLIADAFERFAHRVELFLIRRRQEHRRRAGLRQRLGEQRYDAVLSGERLLRKRTGHREGGFESHHAIRKRHRIDQRPVPARQRVALSRRFPEATSRPSTQLGRRCPSVLAPAPHSDIGRPAETP